MKRILLLTTLLISIVLTITAQTYSVPSSTVGWAQVYNAPYSEDVDGITFTCVGGRNGNRLMTNDVFDFSGKTINVKWKFDKTGGFNRCRLAILGTTIHFSVPTSFTSNAWYYSTLIVNADRTYSFKTASGDYASNGGSVVTNLSGSYASDEWHNITNGVLYFYWDDCGAETTLTIGETIINTEHPKLMGAEPVLDMEDGQIPSEVTTTGAWTVVDDGSGTNNALYIDANAGSKLTFTHANALAVKLDVKVEYVYAARVQLYLNDVVMYALSDYEFGTTQITEGWQTIVIPLPQTAGGKIDLQFDNVKTSITREFWVDNIEYLYANEALSGISFASGVDENVASGSVAANIVIEDKEGDDFKVVLAAVSPMNDNDLFSINEHKQLVINEVPDFETEKNYLIELEANDIVNGFENGFYSNSILLQVNNLNDNEPIIASETISVDEHTANNTIIYTLDYSDADGALNPLVFTPTQGHAAIDMDGDNVIIADESMLDFETDEQIIIKGLISDGTYSNEGVLTINLNNIDDDAPAIAVQPQSLEICEGSNAVLSIDVTGHGTLSYDWHKDGVSMNVPSTSEIEILFGDVDDQAKYSCVVSSEFGTVQSEEIGIAINALPVVELGDKQTITINESATLDAGAGFASYLWNDNSQERILVVSGNSYGVGTHSFTVEVTDSYGCSNSDNVDVEVTVAMALSDKQQNAKLEVYPNPVSEYLMIEKLDVVSATIQIVNLTGRVIHESENVDLSHNYKLDLAYLNEGYYLLKVMTNDQQYVVRILKK